MADELNELKTDPVLDAIYKLIESAQPPKGDRVTVSADCLRALVLAVDELHARENAPGIHFEDEGPHEKST